MKKFWFSFILVLVVVVQVFPQTYSKMELWVDRIPVVKDSTIKTHCIKQKVMLYVDPMRFGVVSDTDTIALVAEKKLRYNKLSCLDLVSGDTYIYESYIADDGFIIFITPQTRLKAKYSLVYSTIPCEE